MSFQVVAPATGEVRAILGDKKSDREMAETLADEFMWATGQTFIVVQGKHVYTARPPTPEKIGF